MKTVSESITEALKKHPTLLDHQIAKKVSFKGRRVTVPQVKAVRASKGLPIKRASGDKTVEVPSRKGVSKSAFARMFDTTTRCREAIRRGIKSLTGDELLPDAQFRAERCGLSSAVAWKSVSEEEEFMGYQCTTAGGKVWWASVETIKWAVSNVQGAHARS